MYYCEECESIIDNPDEDDDGILCPYCGYTDIRFLDEDKWKSAEEGY